MTSVQEILVRVDAGPAIGLGHAMRCLALAQGWQDSGGSAAFLLAESVAGIEDRLSREGVEVLRLHVAAGSDEDARRTAETATERESAWVVLDGYCFGAGYQKTLTSASHRVLAFDDYGHTGHSFADLVVNQNLGADPALYRDREPGTRLLLGPRYVVLQRDFREHSRPTRALAPVAKRVLVTLGGVDRANVTLTVLRALDAARLPEAEIRVVAGSANPNLESLKTAAAVARNPTEIKPNPSSLAAAMAWADMAIAGAGTTSYELAYMGVPSLLIVLADNQRRVAEALDGACVARSLGWHGDLAVPRLAQAIEELAQDAAARERMSMNGRGLVDGQGVPRVVTNLNAELITLRPVREGDAPLLWEWANDPSVRSVSFTHDPIPWEDHLRWFAAKRKDPACLFYLALNRTGEPFGQIRFDCRGDEADVSVSLDARHRARGQGSALILAGSRKVFASTRVRTLYAYVKQGNEPSVRAFAKAGYVLGGTTTVRGQRADRFVLKKEASG